MLIIYTYLRPNYGISSKGKMGPSSCQNRRYYLLIHQLINLVRWVISHLCLGIATGWDRGGHEFFNSKLDFLILPRLQLHLI